jgi:hypothetical protein
LLFLANDILEELYDKIETAMYRLKVSSSDHLTLDDFCHIYETYYKRSLSLSKYNLSSLDQLVCKLKSLGRVVINDEDGTISYTTREIAHPSQNKISKDGNNNSRMVNGNVPNGEDKNSRNASSRKKSDDDVYDDQDPKKRVSVSLFEN